MKINYKHIVSFLESGNNKASRITGFVGLLIGCTLLLCSLQMYLNINELVKPKQQKKNGYDFISVTKSITNENMGKDNRFTKDDIELIKKQTFVTGAAPLQGNQFRAKASAGDVIPFSTELFLESIQDDFLDTLPASFTWEPGQQTVPIIFSADFLELYNVFAPAQGLPQISEQSIQSVSIFIDCYGPSGVKLSFKGQVVALSNRINSVLVPEQFLQWANQTLAESVNENPSRIFIKTADANNPELLGFLKTNGLHVNKDITKFGRVKQILQAVIAGLGGFSIMVILLAMMIFSFYIQLVIARSKDNLTLLQTIGYSPKMLTNLMSKKWLPMFASVIGLSIIITQIIQYIFYRSTQGLSTEANVFISIWVLLVAALLFGMCWLINYKLVKRLLYKLH